jgi:hypothetical protein
MLMIVKGREKKSFGVISITRITVGCMKHTLRCRCEGSPPGSAEFIPHSIGLRSHHRAGRKTRALGGSWAISAVAAGRFS